MSAIEIYKLVAKAQRNTIKKSAIKFKNLSELVQLTLKVSRESQILNCKIYRISVIKSSLSFT